MSPVVKKRKVVRSSSRRPLTTTNSSCDHNQILPSLIEIFNNSQHVTSSDQALTQLKKLYTNADFSKFEKPFMDCLRKLFQSKQSIYFKTTCDFLCKFLQHVTNLQDDRLVRSCIDVADHYMQVSNEDCRLNAVYFVCKFLSHVESLDEEICNALKITLPKRIRDKKPSIRTQAVLASRKFQDNKMIQEGFLHHFNRDPELCVRKALLHTMDIDIFGLDFLVDATQDSQEVMRKSAFLRLGKVSPEKMSVEDLHCVLHNGLVERERQASFSFKTNTLDLWLAKLYDGIDLFKLLKSFDVINYSDDVDRLLGFIHERDLDKVENNGTATKLHHVVESFREHWLNNNNKCLPSVEINERVIAIWMSLVKFCKDNQTVIKPVKVRILPSQACDPNASIENILSSQEQNDEVVELYERLTPDLVNLVEYLKQFVKHVNQATRNKTQSSLIMKSEYMYHKIMDFILSYEVGDELERRVVQDALGSILKENLLTDRFMNFIPPIIKCLYKLVYSSSTNLMINYISELINDVRSHLEDLVTSVQSQQVGQSIIVSSNIPKSRKRVTISQQPPTRCSLTPHEDEQNLEFKIATIRIDLEELKDELEDCIKNKDFDRAKVVNVKIDEKQQELNLLHGRRYSIASDVSHMSLVIDNEPDDNKMSSTMLKADTSLNDSDSSDCKDDTKIFKNHPNELIKCLQMYFACLQNVTVTEVPQTMRNHLGLLSYECLSDWFKNHGRIRSLMVACNGLTALQDEQFAQQETTMTLLIAACFDNSSMEVRTVGFKGLVDVMIKHNNLNVPTDKLEKFLNSSLRDYGKYDPKTIKKGELEFITAIIEGCAKLYYHQKFDSPDILSHLILWWYHPRTYSKLTQFIGVFLPKFVKDVSAKRRDDSDNWLDDLLAETFVKSIEFLHDYILGPGFNIMSESDMLSLINFLTNLVPISFHPKVASLVDKRIDDLSGSCPDLVKYLRQSRNLFRIDENNIPMPHVM